MEMQIEPGEYFIGKNLNNLNAIYFIGCSSTNRSQFSFSQRIAKRVNHRDLPQLLTVLRETYGHDGLEFVPVTRRK